MSLWSRRFILHYGFLSFGLFSVPAPPSRFAVSGGVFLFLLRSACNTVWRMQDGAVWKLAGTEARLDFAGLLATVDLTQPELGLAGIHYQGHHLSSTALLGVELQRRHTPPIAESYVRQRDLVVTYAQTPALRFRVQIYWRAASGPVGSPAIDLQVSVQTSLLDSLPRLTAITKFQSVDLLHQREDHAGGDQPTNYHYELFRPVEREVSYVEMIHPADEASGSIFVGGRGSSPRPEDGSVSHELFASDLEKGVILRARLRGVFLPRERDTELAAEAYRQFLAAPPPLTT